MAERTSPCGIPVSNLKFPDLDEYEIDYEDDMTLHNTQYVSYDSIDLEYRPDLSWVNYHHSTPQKSLKQTTSHNLTPWQVKY